MSMNIAMLIGSVRKGSFTQLIGKTMAEIAPSSVKLSNIKISSLPFFNQDLETTTPEEWTRFRQELIKADAILFITPEYNRSVPAMLKNAIDVGSRPYGKSVFNGKPGAVISSSVSGYGGFGANHHLRQSTAFLNMPFYQKELYLGEIASNFDSDGGANDRLKKALTNFLEGYIDWIKIFR